MMKQFSTGIYFLLMILIIACSTKASIVNHINGELKEHVGQKVTLQGRAENAKLGAILEMESGEIIWMDDMKSWPNGYYTEETSKRVQVTGVLTERYDLPVYNPSDSIIRQGVEMPEGKGVEESSHRFVITKYTWGEIK
jgi:hypothetical protein